MAIQFELFTFKRGDSESKASYILSKGPQVCAEILPGMTNITEVKSYINHLDKRKLLGLYMSLFIELQRKLFWEMSEILTKVLSIERTDAHFQIIQPIYVHS